MSSNVIRNRVTEKDVRAWMDKNGFYGGSAEIHRLELHAIERPGWLQIFSFEARVKSRKDSEHPWRELYGVVKDDERRRGANKTKVELFGSIEQQTEKLEQWSQGLIAKKTNGDLSSTTLLLLIAGGVVCAAITFSLINLFT